MKCDSCGKESDLMLNDPLGAKICAKCVKEELSAEIYRRRTVGAPQKEYNELEAERDALKALLAEAVEFVKMAGDQHHDAHDVGYCQCCGKGSHEQSYQQIHAPDCRLNVWLKKAGDK